MIAAISPTFVAGNWKAAEGVGFVAHQVIAAPTITMEGDANGAPHPEPSAYAKKFSGKYEHRPLAAASGTTCRQEAPQAFADAIVSVARA